MKLRAEPQALDPRCPFTSTPLTIEECLPDEELKSKITAFVDNRRAERLRQKAEAGTLADASAMQLDEKPSNDMDLS